MRPYQTVKRILDVLFSLFLLLILSPVMIAAFWAIWLESGSPVLFKQQRLGLMGKPFMMYKLRTMVQDAEKTGTGVYTCQEDPRITKVGRFLRKTSLDEIPQLFNVLKGDMSLIGPRPTLTYHPYRLEEYPVEFRIRFKVLPGISGLAQVSGRKELQWKERLILDRAYVMNFGFWQDVRIFFRTILKIVTMEGCYNSDEAMGNPGENRKREGTLAKGCESAAIRSFGCGTGRISKTGSENLTMGDPAKGAAGNIEDKCYTPSLQRFTKGSGSIAPVMQSFTGRTTTAMKAGSEKQ